MNYIHPHWALELPLEAPSGPLFQRPAFMNNPPSPAKRAAHVYTAWGRPLEGGKSTSSSFPVATQLPIAPQFRGGV